MSTFLLLHGAGSDGWYWHRVARLLVDAGHRTVAPDLPVTDDEAGLDDYVDVAVRSVAGAGADDDVVVVAQSLGGLVAPVVCARRPARLLVMVAAMIPAPGEAGGDWWSNTGWPEPDDMDPERVFLHDVPADIAAASADHAGPQSGRVFEDPCPLAAWPEVETRVLLCRDDRFFPADFQRRVARERLGITPDEMDGGHLPALARPDDLALRLLSYAGGRGSARR